VGGALVGAPTGGGKKNTKDYNDDGGTMSVGKAYKSGKLKAGRSNKTSKKKRKKANKKTSRGAAKAHAKIMSQEGEPPEDESTLTPTLPSEARPVETPSPAPTGTPEPTATEEPSPWLVFKRLPEGIEPITAPMPERTPTPTPTAEEMERARARRLAQAEQEYIELEPLEYIRYNVYWANGIDYYELAANREDNTLPLEVINNNNTYPGGVRPAISMIAAEEINSSFVRELRMDPTHYPNYEPVFFEELKRVHAKVYSEIVDDMTGEEEVKVVTTEEIASRQIIRTIYSLVKRWWSYEAGVH
jgi:hypothetical protein